MSKLKELIAQKAALEQQILEVRKTELTEAIEKVNDIIAEYGLTADDIFPSGKSKIKVVKKVVAKYRDPVSGKTWTGRGMTPKWIVDKEKSEFAIPA